MSRLAVVQNVGNRLQKIESIAIIGEESKKMCPCGLHCQDVCYRKEFNELVDILACCDKPGIDESSVAITVSTFGHRTVQSGEYQATRKTGEIRNSQRPCSDAAESASSGSRTSSTVSGIRNRSDNSNRLEFTQVFDSNLKHVASFQEKDLIDDHSSRKPGSSNA